MIVAQKWQSLCFVFGEQSLDSRFLQRQLKLIEKYLSERHLTGAVGIGVVVVVSSLLTTNDFYEGKSAAQHSIKGVMKNGLRCGPRWRKARAKTRRKRNYAPWKWIQLVRISVWRILNACPILNVPSAVGVRVRICVVCANFRTNKMSAFLEGIRRRCRRRHRSSVMIPIYCWFIAWDVPEWKTAGRQKRTAWQWCVYDVNERRSWFQLRVIGQSVWHVNRFETFR